MKAIQIVTNTNANVHEMEQYILVFAIDFVVLNMPYEHHLPICWQNFFRLLNS